MMITDIQTSHKMDETEDVPTPNPSIGSTLPDLRTPQDISKLPCKQWNIHEFEDKVVIAHMTSEFKLDKQVIFKLDSPQEPTIIINGVNWRAKYHIKCNQEVFNLLHEVDRLRLCQGIGKLKAFSPKCSGAINCNQQHRCNACSAERKKLQKREARLQNLHKTKEKKIVNRFNSRKRAKLNLKKRMSKGRCVVPSCTPECRQPPYFKFPKEKGLCLQWLLSIPKGWTLNQYSTVCSRHFKESDVLLSNGKGWLRAGAVPTLYLESNTTDGKDSQSASANEEAQADDAADSQSASANEESQADDAAGLIIEDAMPSASGPAPKFDSKYPQEDSSKVKTSADDDSGSDLEIIEPKIETFEVSDTSDEDVPPPYQPPPSYSGLKKVRLPVYSKQPTPSSSGLKKVLLPVNSMQPSPNSSGLIKLSSTPQITSLSNLQISEVHSLQNRPNVIVKSKEPSGNVIRVDADSKIKCCVPRCGSVAGNPIGIGFHSFPLVGETKLSVRSIDNKLTVHDLFSMWKSLLSVPDVTEDSYVCTRHFTSADYTGNTLNKVAVPTQFLPTPVTFAPCKVQEKPPPPPTLQPPPLVLLNKSKNPPSILRKPTAQPGFNYGSSTIRFPGIPVVVNNPIPVRGKNPPSGLNNKVPIPRLPNSTRLLVPIRMPSVAKMVTNNANKNAGSQPNDSAKLSSSDATSSAVDQKRHPRQKLGCSIDGCVNKGTVDTQVIMFRLPYNIDRCKEWVYTCGHPEWLDQGMVIARSLYRICVEHFEDNMFLDETRKTLKGSAKPTVKVQEPYKKCVVAHCNNFYDKARLHYIGVDFAQFPNNTDVFTLWVNAVKGRLKNFKLTKEDIDEFTGAVICSLHFRNVDYISGPSGKTLSLFAVPSMNLVYLKEPVNPPSPSADSTEVTSNSTATDTPTVPSLPRRGRPPNAAGRLRGTARRGRPPKSAPPAEVVDNSNSDASLEANSTVKNPNRRRSRLSLQKSGGNEEDESKNDKPSNKKSGETLYGRSGRPLRSAVLKRKSIVESGSDSDGSCDGPSSKRRESAKSQSGEESSSERSFKRTLRPRRAAARKSFRVSTSSSQSDEDVESQGEKFDHFLGPYLPAADEGLTEADEEPATTSVEAAAEIIVEPAVEIEENNPVEPSVVIDVEPVEEVMLCSEETGVDGREKCGSELVNVSPQAAGEDDTERIEMSADGGDAVQTATIARDGDAVQIAATAGDGDAVQIETAAADSSSVMLDVSTNQDSTAVTRESVEPDPEARSTADEPKLSDPKSIAKDSSVSKTAEDVEGPTDDPSDVAVITFGPKLPTPTVADIEFFRSILPTVAGFNQFQKTELRSTIVATLEEMLDEHLEHLKIVNPTIRDSRLPCAKEPQETNGL